MACRPGSPLPVTVRDAALAAPAPLLQSTRYTLTGCEKGCNLTGMQLP